jgi:hypothetical protein
MAKDSVSFYFGASSSGETSAGALNTALVSAQNGLADKVADKLSPKRGGGGDS